MLLYTGVCALLPRPGLLAGSPGRGSSRDRVSEPPSSLEGKFIMETKATLGPSAALPVPFPPELPAEMPREHACTPRLGHAAGKCVGDGGGPVCFGHRPAARRSPSPAAPRGTQPGCSGTAKLDVGCCPSLGDSDPPPGSGSPRLSPGWAQLPPSLASPVPCPGDRLQKGPRSCAALPGLLPCRWLLVAAIAPSRAGDAWWLSLCHGDMG